MEASVDICTTKNLEKLVHIGESLLKKPLSKVNLETGRAEALENCGTNEDALIKYGKICNASSHTLTHIYVILYFSN